MLEVAAAEQSAQHYRPTMTLRLLLLLCGSVLAFGSGCASHKEIRSEAVTLADGSRIVTVAQKPLPWWISWANALAAPFTHSSSMR